VCAVWPDDGDTSAYSLLQCCVCVRACGPKTRPLRWSKEPRHLPCYLLCLLHQQVNKSQRRARTRPALASSLRFGFGSAAEAPRRGISSAMSREQPSPAPAQRRFIAIPSFSSSGCRSHSSVDVVDTARHAGNGKKPHPQGARARTPQCFCCVLFLSTSGDSYRRVVAGRG
jgi:hypothetical protein